MNGTKKMDNLKQFNNEEIIKLIKNGKITIADIVNCMFFSVLKLFLRRFYILLNKLYV